MDDVFLRGDLAYLADTATGLTIVDIRTPTAPKIAGSGASIFASRALTVSGKRAYVVGYPAELRIFDISDPTSPVVLGDWNGLGFLRDVAVLEDLAYLADEYAGLRVIDVGIPENPRQVKIFDGQLPEGVYLVGSTLYSADASAGISIYRTGTSIFYNGFESGDTTAWSSVTDPSAQGRVLPQR
jgi:hypothetical protein